ncbi:helix-turn-helix transcriptional regulator [Aquimarina algicola]|uniref:Helix-turn-helix transcriptional regulator n=1 Tax=Aquimarina algicola TaxID=2589995 RepID=A0A504JAD2_9FLAO|nr:helix-turn-helix transcriptional regulator [Aquimarina algicola]TPN83859.1 helix-turn-helix transcriptional regulator [Aquimarina algicola]
MNIKKERIEREMTQQQFAELLGVTRKTIVNYESGGNIPETKEKLFKNILKNYDNNISFSEANHINKTVNVPNNILEKFKDISDDEVALYVDYKRASFLKHSLIKSLIKAEAWRIVENEMREVIIENKLSSKK